MLASCAGSGATPPPTEPDPVVEVRYETRVTCPAELRLDPPARPALPAGAVVEASPDGAAWLAAEMAWAGTILTLLRDARAACPD